MFGHDTKYLSSSPPVRFALLLTIFSFLSLSLLLQCSRSDSTDDTSTSSSPTVASADTSFNRPEGFEQAPDNIQDQRTFLLTDTYTIGPIKEDIKKLRAWLEVPLETEHQIVHEIKIDAGDLSYDITEDKKLGNRFLYIEIENPEKKTYNVTVNSRITRKSIREPYSADLSEEERKFYLQKTSDVPVGEEMKTLAHKQDARDTGPESARKIYDFVVNNSTYYKANPDKFSGSSKGDIGAEYCLFQKQGGCTDFHALQMAMGRSINIPTRFNIGAYLPPKFEGKDQDVAYHCWAETYHDGKGWLTLDAAYADLWPDKHDFFFGQLDARRVLFSRGRGISLVPEADQPVEYFILGHVEADGEIYENWDRKLTYKEVK